MNISIDEEIDGAVREAIKNVSPYGFDDKMYATVYVDTITSLHNKNYIDCRYAYAYTVAENSIKAVLIERILDIIKNNK